MKLSVRVLFWFYCALLVINSFPLSASLEHDPEDDDWVDPFDMLNYDASTKTMRKRPEASSYSNVPTKRREHSPEAQSPDMKMCTDRVNKLQQEIEEHRRKATFSPQQPTCYPVFKRFLTKLLKEIKKIELPTAQTAEMHYDAEVKLTSQMVAEIQKIVNDDGSWRTGALDDALSQILINFKRHDYEAWKWRFEDTFGVELNTLIKVSVFVLIIVTIICTEMWSLVSWFVQFRRMFALCFIVSLVWNWFYLYQTAFAEHKANFIKIWNHEDRCTGVKKIDWMDNLKEWFRTTMTLQDDPCKQYYEALLVNPVLLVPPTKAITITLTSFITDPMKQLGDGIGEFLRALLKDLPVTLQIPVFLLIGLSLLAFVYSSTQAAVHHAVLGPRRGNRQDPPPGIEQQPAVPPLQGPERHREVERAEQAALPRHLGQEGNHVNHMGNQGENRPEVRQRRPVRQRQEQQRGHVETLGNADSLYSGDEADTGQEAAVAEDRDQHAEEELHTFSNEQMEEDGASAFPAEKKHNPSAETDSKDNRTSGNTEKNEVRDSASRDASKNKNCVENIGTPVQDTMQCAPP